MNINENTSECTITPELISVDIAFANAKMSDMQEAINMKAYHAAQAIEKSLKYALYISNIELFQEIGNSHSIAKLMLVWSLYITDLLRHIRI